MIFNTLTFAVFFVVTLALYSLLRRRGQNLLLLAASYFFYGWWDYRFLSLLLLSTIIDYCAGWFLDQETRPRLRRLYLAISMAANLVILGFFKYFNFFIDSADQLLQVLGFSSSSWHLNIVLPVGISFYTFQTMSYTIDIYRRQLKATANVVEFATFVSFFPQLVAGPIERARDLLPQFAQDRQCNWSTIRGGLWLIFWGLFKKVVIADNLATIADRSFDTLEGVNAFSVIVSTYAFAFQILCDFSGYSDMARGLANCMGFRLMVNFRNPYYSLNPKEFWTRWHISLSSWLRDYLYIPLGGSRKGPRRTYINLMVTMLLGGLWHGAAWHFVLWGAYQGALLVIHRFFGGGQRSTAENKSAPSLFSPFLQRMVMFQFICLGWLFFRATSVKDIGYRLLALSNITMPTSQELNGLITMIVLCLPLWLVEYLDEHYAGDQVAIGLSLVPRSLLFAGLLAMMLGFANTGSHSFIYFQF